MTRTCDNYLKDITEAAKEQHGKLPVCSVQSRVEISVSITQLVSPSQGANDYITLTWLMLDILFYYLA